MKRLSFLLILLFVSTLVPAQALLHKIIKSGEIRVGTSGTQPPFSVKTKSGEIIGYEIDVAEMLAEKLGVKVTVVEMPFAQLLEALEKKQVDVVMSNMAMTTERNIKVAFKGPHMISGKSLLTKTPTLKTVTSAGEINNDFTTIAVLKSSTSEVFAKENTPMAKLVTVNDYDEAIVMLQNGKIDLLLADYAICAYSVLTNPNAGFYTLQQPLSIEPIGLAMPASDPLFLNLVDNFIVNATLNGQLEKLQEKWFDNGDWVEQVK